MNKVVLLLLLLVISINAERYALLVGNSSGGRDLVNLQYVGADISEMGDVLQSNCHFEPENIITLQNDTPDDLIHTLESLSQTVQVDDLFLFYYTGHADGRSLRMGESRLALVELKQALDSVPSQLQLVVLDACQSGSFSRLKGGTIEAPLELPQDENNSGRVVLYSSSDTEFSQESEYLGHSVFSFYFTNGLKGMADHSGDRKVTVDEAYNYAYHQTVAATVNSSGGIQHPGYLFNYSGRSDIILSDMTSDSSGIILDRSLQGSFVVLTPSRDVIADFVSSGDRDMFIALNPGRYSIYKNADGSASHRRVDISNSIQFVNANSFEPIRSIPSTGKGEREQQHVALGVQAGVICRDHSTLSNSMNSLEFFNVIEIPFSSSLQTYSPYFGGSFGLHFPQGVIGDFTFMGAKLMADQSLNGTVTGPVDDQYQSSLFLTEELSLFETTGTMSYRFKHGIVRNLHLGGGFALTFNSYTFSGKYTEELFNSEVIYDRYDRDLSLSFLLTTGYTFQLGRRVELGADITYGFDMASSKATEILIHNSSGLRGNLGLSFIL